jgi:hypothetical protein
MTARLAWSVPSVTVLLLAATLVLEGLNDRLSGEDALVGYGVAVMSITFTAVGALIASRRPENAIGWMFCAVGTLQALNVFGTAYATYGAVTDPGSLPAPYFVAWVKEWCWIPSVAVLGTFLLLLFPDGHLPSRRWRLVAWPTGVAIGCLVVVAAVALWPERTEIALGIDVDEGDDALAPAIAGFLVVLLGALASVVSVIVRFRRSKGVERQQLKWFAFAAALAVVSLASEFTPAGSGSGAFVLVGVLSVPLATGAAILRHRLYDIDVVINRTLVYGALTATLAAVYLLLALVIGLTVGESDVAVAASTLAVAALFRPARARIQALVDRRFYRRRYDAARTLEAFGARLRDELDLETMAADLRGVARDTLQPAHVSLWLRSSR